MKLSPPLFTLSILSGLFLSWGWAAFELSRYGMALALGCAALCLGRAALWCNDEARSF